MIAYHLTSSVRIISIFLLMITVIVNAVVFIMSLQVSKDKFQLLWPLRRLMLIAGLYTFGIELAKAQLNLMEGVVDPSGVWMHYLLLPGLLLTCFLWWVYDDNLYIKVISAFYLGSYGVLLMEWHIVWVVVIFVFIALIEALYSVYHYFVLFDSMTVSDILSGLSEFISQGIAVYGRDGQSIDMNSAYREFISLVLDSRNNFANLCDLLNIPQLYDGEVKYSNQDKTFNIYIEHLPRNKVVVVIDDVTIIEQAIADEQKLVDILAKQNMLISESIQQQTQIQLLEHKKHAIYDLHDNIGQILAIISMSAELDVFKRVSGQPSDKLLTAIDSLNSYLNSELIDFYYPLDVALERLKMTYEAFGVEVSISDRKEQLTRKQQEMVALICYEAVLNAIKHANAKRIRIVWHPTPEVLLLIENPINHMNGFKVGIGMTGMQKRAESIGMQLNALKQDNRFIVVLVKDISCEY